VRRWVIADSPSTLQVEEIGALLRSGGVVLMPTDTIYGLHALAGSDAVARIVQIKGRDENKPFVTIAASASQIEALGVTVPAIVRDLWPAPLTAILRRGTSTIAIRVPDLEWLRSLLEKSGPLVSTSANRAGEPTITSADDLSSALLEALDGVVDGGRREGKPSAIVDFTGDVPRILREGDSRFTQKLRKSLRKCL